MFCGNCGNQIPDQVENCPFCGCRLVATPQPAVQQYAPQPQVQPQTVPTQAGVPVQAAAAPAVCLAPVSVGLSTPKNANKERINLEAGAIWYVEITNNVLIISHKGGTASMMFGALGYFLTNAMCSMKPSLTFTADQIRNMTYKKVLGGQLLQIELFDGKLLSINAKADVENTIENWWRNQMHY